MTVNTTVHYDEALPLAVACVREQYPDLCAEQVRFVRDTQGYLFVVVPDGVPDETLAALREHLHARLGHYSPSVDAVALRYADTLEGEQLLQQPALAQLVDGWPAYMLEHWLAGQDWLSAGQRSVRSGKTPRVTFYSLKGGVGRSTALMLWARHMTVQQGKRVLVVDLDLEAPGVASQLLAANELPRFGVIDWLADRLVGAADAAMLDELVAPSVLAEGRQLLVVPAGGSSSLKHPFNYIAKLARAYASGDPDQVSSGFAQRIQALLTALEQRYQPDVVLIDSRAGLHETAAAALLQLDAQVLLFAADLSGTWEGYRYLLSHLGQVVQGSRSSELEEYDWRYRFKMVHAKARPLLSSHQAFQAHAYDTWLETLYDEQLPPDDQLDTPTAGLIDLEAFSFDLDDQAAPHHPLRILQNPSFENIDLRGRAEDLDEHAITDAFGRFFAQLESWALSPEERDD